MTTAPTELKPCPFCGANFLMEQEPHDNYPVNGKFYIFHDYGPLGSPARSCPIRVNRHFNSEAEAIAAWNTRAPAVGGVRVEPLWMADMLSRNAGNTEGAPAWIRVAQDGEGMHGGFWTCAAATENSPQYIRADLVRKALEPQAVDDAMVERVIDAVMGADRYAPKIVPMGANPPLFDGMQIDHDGPWMSRVAVARLLRTALAKEQPHD